MTENPRRRASRMACGALAAVRAQANGHRPPRVILKPRVEDMTFAKPWTERFGGECAFPVAGSGRDTWSCCRPCADTYCDHHREIMTEATSPDWLEKMLKALG